LTTPAPTDEERKQRVVTNFDGLADTYDAMGFVIRTAERLVELAALKPGERVLDLATGTGWAALAAASAVGPTGHVLGTDLAEAALARARSKADAVGLGNVEFATGDAEAPGLPDGDVDVVLCASGIFFLPHPDVAVSEWRRVTRPGGRVLFSSFGPGTVWGPVRGLYEEHLGRFISVAPAPRMLSAAECERLLSGAGFEDIRVVEERLDYHVLDSAAVWTEVWGGVMRLALQPLTAAQLTTFRRDFLADVERLTTSDGIRMEVPAIFASGVVPDLVA
jgi:ubiquinone/menaquinone biosynthesis C-methylase UbiE